MLSATFGLWHLAFSAEGRAALRAHPTVAADVVGLRHAAGTLRKVARNCDGIAFQLSHDAAGITATAATAADTASAASAAATAPVPAANNAGKHIMLSYCWAEQPFALYLRTALQARGYAVWMGAPTRRAASSL